MNSYIQKIFFSNTHGISWITLNFLLPLNPKSCISSIVNKSYLGKLKLSFGTPQRNLSSSQRRHKQRQAVRESPAGNGASTLDCPPSPPLRCFLNTRPIHQVDSFTYSILKPSITTGPHISESFCVSYGWTNLLSPQTHKRQKGTLGSDLK